MTPQHDPGGAHDARSWLKTPAGWALCSFLATGAFDLIAEHTVHRFGVLPWLFLLVYPVKHDHGIGQTFDLNGCA